MHELDERLFLLVTYSYPRRFLSGLLKMTDWWGYDQRSQQSGWYSGDDQQQPVYPNLDSQGFV